MAGDKYVNTGTNYGTMHLGPTYNGKQPFEMTEAVMNVVLNSTDGWDTFGVAPLGSNPKSAVMADVLYRYLSSHGRDARRTGTVGNISGAYGPLFVGTGSVTGDMTPYSKDRIIYVNADG